MRAAEADRYLSPRVPALLSLALLLAACGEPAVDVEIELAGSVAQQRGNVTTDLILVSADRGLERLGHGWSLVVSEDGTVAEAAAQAQIDFFSATGDTIEIRIEATSSAGPLGVGVMLNGERLEHLRVASDWKTRVVRIPDGVTRQGRNFLHLTPRVQKVVANGGTAAALRLRRVEFRSADGRTTRATAAAISLEHRPDTDGKAVIRMPTASYLDLVARMPDRAHFSAEVSLARAPTEGPVTVAVEVLAPIGHDIVLAEQALDTSAGPQHLDLDLAPWANQPVRLRVRVSSPFNAVVEWRDARIHGLTGASAVGGPPVVEPAVPPISGRLGRPDVLIVLLDAARADAFGSYGGPYPTPAADRLAAEGTRFDSAMAPASWTGQSVPSILTGFYPDSLGVGPWGSTLPSDVATLAELAREAGYHTALWSQHPFYRQAPALLRGFDRVAFGPPKVYDALPDADDLYLPDQPSLALVHLLPPHTPYEPPAPFRGTRTDGYTGSVEATTENLVQFPSRRRPRELSADDRSYIRNRYQENVAFADSLLDTLLQQLERSDRYDDAIVVLLSDHGEAFLEHGYFLHSAFVFREYLRVPLIVKWPSSVLGFDRVVVPPVSLVDLVPTLVDGLALTPGERGFQGRSLLPAVLDDRPPDHTIYALTRGAPERDRAATPSAMLLSASWKLIFDPRNLAAQLFDTSDDPDELQDLAASSPQRLQQFTDAIQEQRLLNRSIFQAPFELYASEPMDPELADELRALGYLN